MSCLVIPVHYQVFSDNSKYQPIGNQTEQVELFWNTSDALIVIDRTIFLSISESIVERDVHMDQLLVEHNLFDAVTTFGIGFKSKDMRDQFNSGLTRMCESGVYRELLVEYGIGADDSEVICDLASGGAGLTVMLSTLVVVVSFSLLFQWY